MFTNIYKLFLAVFYSSSYVNTALLVRACTSNF